MISPAKLAQNNVNAIYAFLNALRIIRTEGGFGEFSGAVKDGKVMFVKTTIRVNCDEGE